MLKSCFSFDLSSSYRWVFVFLRLLNVVTRLKAVVSSSTIEPICSYSMPVGDRLLSIVGSNGLFPSGSKSLLRLLSTVSLGIVRQPFASVLGVWSALKAELKALQLFWFFSDWVTWCLKPLELPYFTGWLGFVPYDNSIWLTLIDGGVEPPLSFPPFYFDF